jgi:hypothetical protein
MELLADGRLTLAWDYFRGLPVIREETRKPFGSEQKTVRALSPTCAILTRQLAAE